MLHDLTIVGGALQYLKMVGNFCSIDPYLALFWTFSDHIGSLFYAQLDLINLLLKQFVPIFSLIFDLVDPLFPCY